MAFGPPFHCSSSLDLVGDHFCRFGAMLSSRLHPVSVVARSGVRRPLFREVFAPEIFYSLDIVRIFLDWMLPETAG
jgi:hypothetical protein